MCLCVSSYTIYIRDKDNWSLRGSTLYLDSYAVERGDPPSFFVFHFLFFILSRHGEGWVPHSLVFHFLVFQIPVFHFLVFQIPVFHFLQGRRRVGPFYFFTRYECAVGNDTEVRNGVVRRILVSLITH
jgi:hypothetical protein